MDRNAFCKALWQAKLARKITPNGYLIGRALLRRACRRGCCWPSLERLAQDIGCRARTAGRAVNALSAAGLLSWVQRRARWNRRDSNLYTLRVPAGAEKIRESIFESSRAKMSNGSRPAPIVAEPPRDPAAVRAAQAALAARRAAFERQQRAGWRPGTPWPA